MSTAIERSARQATRRTRRVTPSRVDPATAGPFTLDQELEPFGRWVSDPIWVPPKDASKAMAETMVEQTGMFASKEKRWAKVVNQHRASFTQVRQIELKKASIRLPEGKLFVSVTEQNRFDEITDNVPACVQTRLDEFLAGPGKQPGVRVYYLKPLCVEVDDQLLLTSQRDLMRAIEKIQDEVFEEYAHLYLRHHAKRLLIGSVNSVLAVPRDLVNYFVQRRQRKMDAYQAQLEFKRRRTALRVRPGSSTMPHRRMYVRGDVVADHAAGPHRCCEAIRDRP